MPDIIDDFLQRLTQHVPDLPASVPLQLEQSLRQQWGGTEPYVGKRLNRVTRSTLVAAGLRQQKPLRQVFQDAGVGLRTGYRLLAAKPSRK